MPNILFARLFIKEIFAVICNRAKVDKSSLDIFHSTFISLTSSSPTQDYFFIIIIILFFPPTQYFIIYYLYCLYLSFSGSLGRVNEAKSSLNTVFLG